MPIPETTSTEAFERYVDEKVLRACRGKAWREIKAWTTALPRVVDSLPLPSVSEPFLAWTISDEVEFQEREGNRPWITHQVKKGSFFLTSGGAPYDCRWKVVTSEPFESMAVFIELPLLERALDEVFGDDAIHARLRGVSAFTDVALNSLMERLHDALMRRKPQTQRIIVCCLFIKGRPNHHWPKDDAKQATNAENEKAIGSGIRCQCQNTLGMGNRSKEAESPAQKTTIGV